MPFSGIRHAGRSIQTLALPRIKTYLKRKRHYQLRLFLMKADSAEMAAADKRRGVFAPFFSRSTGLINWHLN